MMPPDTSPMRVAAYCRVSTDSDDQANSLHSQQLYFESYIRNRPGWQLAGIYADEGLSGTSTNKRTAFLQMMCDAGEGRFDLVLTKEISRFARNTLDSIYYTRKLRALGIGVIFMGDNINTLDADAELRLTILSSIAQEESRKTSERVKWGQKRRMEQGVVFGRDLLGYDVRGGKLYINEPGAAVVRRIFRQYVEEGRSAGAIARALAADGIPTPPHMKSWSGGAVLRILRNEKYCGDLVQKKTYTPNYLTHQKRKNRGEESMVALRDHHPPIIQRELFARAQAELLRRAAPGGKRDRHTTRHCFSGKVRCGLCGRTFVARSKKRADGGVYRSWRCYGAVHPSGGDPPCPCPSVGEAALRDMLLAVMGDIQPLAKSAAVDLWARISPLLAGPGEKGNPVDVDTALARIAAKRQRLLELYLSGDIDREEFCRAGADYAAQAAALGSAPSPCKGAAEKEKARYLGIPAALDALVDERCPDDSLIRHLLEEVVLHPESGAAVKLVHLPFTWRFSPDGEQSSF